MSKVCTVKDCGQPHYGHGYCRLHWSRWRKTGTTDLAPHRLPFEKKWELFYVPSGEGCWEWRGAIDKHTGYGRLNEQWAHRVSYERNVGPIPPKYQIDHLCRNRACVRPDHLEAVTQRENIRRGMAPAIVTARTGVCKRGHSMEDAYVAHRSSGAVTRRCRRCHLDSEKTIRDRKMNP